MRVRRTISENNTAAKMAHSAAAKRPTVQRKIEAAPESLPLVSGMYLRLTAKYPSLGPSNPYLAANPGLEHLSDQPLHSYAPASSQTFRLPGITASVCSTLQGLPTLPILRQPLAERLAFDSQGIYLRV